MILYLPEKNMKRIILMLVMFVASAISSLKGQVSNEPKNLSSDILTKSGDKLVFGGYGQIDFTKPFTNDRAYNSSLDVSRLILSMGYNFTPKTSFFSEIEFEHVRELYVEQAFLTHSFNEFLNFRAGLLLVPMGIINEYHEPTTFNGVLRPTIDNIIVPTTWREIGFGFTGRFVEQGIKYQIYVLNGFTGYNGANGLINGKNFLRDARQKGARAIMTTPDISAKIDYFGIAGLKLGLSGYFGKSESTLFNNLDLTNTASVARADSTVAGIVMTGIDARYNIGGLALRGEFIMSFVSNTSQYNTYTGSDAGSKVRGMYGEIAYNVLRGTNSDYTLTPFFRYENYDTHFSVDAVTPKQDKYRANEFVFGIGWKPAEGAVLKADIQVAKTAADATARKTFNAGVGVWF